MRGNYGLLGLLDWAHGTTLGLNRGGVTSAKRECAGLAAAERWWWRPLLAWHGWHTGLGFLELDRGRHDEVVVCTLSFREQPKSLNSRFGTIFLTCVCAFMQHCKRTYVCSQPASQPAREPASQQDSYAGVVCALHLAGSSGTTGRMPCPPPQGPARSRSRLRSQHLYAIATGPGRAEPCALFSVYLCV